MAVYLLEQAVRVKVKPLHVPRALPGGTSLRLGRAHTAMEYTVQAVHEVRHLEVPRCPEAVARRGWVVDHCGWLTSPHTAP